MGDLCSRLGHSRSPSQLVKHEHEPTVQERERVGGMGHRVSESEISDHSKEITCWFSKWHEINLHCVYSSSLPSSHSRTSSFSVSPFLSFS